MSSDRPSLVLAQRPVELSLFERMKAGLLEFLEDLGIIAWLTWRTLLSMFQRPLELRSTLHQLDRIGVASTALACITAVFTGMVMAIQFAYGLQKFGGMEYVGRVIGLSFARELAPTLTAVIVGGRIGSGIAAEVGAMNVTEQVDAIRALGADPVKKLVMPRVVACVIALPILCFFALALGFTGAMVMVNAQFDIPMTFFYKSALDSAGLRDIEAGMVKTPVFGYIIAIIGCHFGLKTRGGTEGVGTATTSTVVSVAITILVADFFLTKLSLIIF